VFTFKITYHPIIALAYKEEFLLFQIILMLPSISLTFYRGNGLI